MSRNYIRDSSNKTVGYTEQSGNRNNLFTEGNQRCGYVDVKTDRVYDAQNRFVGKGSQLLGTLLKS